MPNKEQWTRRQFLQTTGAVGAAAAMTPALSLGQDTTELVPTRPFGKTGVDVPILSMGGIFDIPNNSIVLHQAWRYGVRYWDTAYGYMKGRSEEGIGTWLARYPERRKDIFLVSKASGAQDAQQAAERLEKSLERLQTDYVDLYFIHGVRDIAFMENPEIKAFAEKAKKEGKIKLFGFSTHKNMADLLLAAPKLGYIDGIMMTYNYRLMHEDKMRRGVDACVEAGIGLTAMKTQGGGSINDTDEDQKIAGHFLGKGFTPGQAKVKAVLENEDIAAVCSQMPNVDLLKENTAAVLGKTELSQADRAVLYHHAQATCGGYCAGCANICETIAALPVSSVMRYMMYHNNYGPEAEARAQYHAIPAQLRQRMVHADFTAAEKACPNHLPIAQMMKEAQNELA